MKKKPFLFLRGHNVILDHDAASLYGLTTAELTTTVKHHCNRFPKNFTFQLTQTEWKKVIFEKEFSGKETFSPPHAFTKKGLLMLACVLSTKKAINTNKHLIENFLKIQKSEFLLTNNNPILNTIKNLINEGNDHEGFIVKSFPVKGRYYVK